MSLHLGSSKYDEHTVRKGISNQHFDHRANKGALSPSPALLPASQVTSLGNEAAEPHQDWWSSCHCGSLWPQILPIALPAVGLSPAPLGTAPHRHRGSIPSQHRAVLHGKAGICARPGMLPPLEWEGWEPGAHCFCWGSQQSWEQGKRGGIQACTVKTAHP